MKNSIRLLALLLVLVMSLSIVACNGTTEESSQAATEARPNRTPPIWTL